MQKSQTVFCTKVHKICELQGKITSAKHRCLYQHSVTSSPPSYSGQFPEVSLRLSSSVMMMFSMSFIVRWSRKAWNSTCFSSSRDSCCMSNCRGTRQSMQRHSQPDTGVMRPEKWRGWESGWKCTCCVKLWHECVLYCRMHHVQVRYVRRKGVSCNVLAVCLPVHHCCYFWCLNQYANLRVYERVRALI